MLILDLAALSNAQVRNMIWARCKSFGSVHAVSIHRDSATRPEPFALVDMASAGEVKAVIGGIGDEPFGGSALIRLSQDPPPADDRADARPHLQSEVPSAVADPAIVRAWLQISGCYLLGRAAPTVPAGS